MALPPVLDEENLYKFRTKICERYVKQGKCEFADKCQYSHDLRWTRRPPWKYTYSPELCRDLVFVTDGRGRTIAKSNCKQKRNCRFAHTKEEQMYHPKVYKTAICHQFKENGWCDRYYCPFAHSEAELRPAEQTDDSRKTFSKPAVQEALCPDIYLPSDRPHPRLRARFLAIMDGIPSQNHLHLALDPSYLSSAGGTRTRQPYTDFISSHTPHSVLSEGSPSAQAYAHQKGAASSRSAVDLSGTLDGSVIGGRAAKDSSHQLPTSRQHASTNSDRRTHRATSRLVQLLQAKQCAGNTLGDHEATSKPITLPGTLQPETYQPALHPSCPRPGVASALTAISDIPPYASAYASTHSAASAQQWTSVPGSPVANRAHNIQAELSKAEGSAGTRNAVFESPTATVVFPYLAQEGEGHPNATAASSGTGGPVPGGLSGAVPHSAGDLSAVFGRAGAWLSHQPTKLHIDTPQPGALPCSRAWSDVDRYSTQQREAQEKKAAVAGDFRVKCLTSDVCYWNEPIGRSRDDPSVLVYAGLILGPGKTREVVAVKQLPVVVSNRAGELWREVQRFLTISDPHLVNIKRALFLPGEADEGTSLWVITEKCQGSIIDMFPAGTISPSFLQAAFPSTGLNGLLHYLLRSIQTLHHQSKSAHMRIHPGNIMLGCRGEVKLGDCAGKIRYLSILDLLHAGIQGASNAKALLQWILGTPQETCWMAPEFLTSLLDLDEELSQTLWQTSNAVDEDRNEQAFASVGRSFRWPSDFLRRADAWSAGATLFYIASGGFHPYGSANDPLILANILADKKLHFDKLNNCPWLADLLAGLLCHKPAQRLSVTQALHHPLFWTSEDIEKYLEDLRAAIEQPGTEESARLQAALSYSTNWVESLAYIPSPAPLLPVLLSYMAVPSASPQLLAAHPLQNASSFLVFLACIAGDKRIALVERRLIVSECLMAHAAPFLHSVYLFLFPKLTNDQATCTNSSGTLDFTHLQGYGWNPSTVNTEGSHLASFPGGVSKSTSTSTRPNVAFSASIMGFPAPHPNSFHSTFRQNISGCPSDAPGVMRAVPPPPAGPEARGMVYRDVINPTWGGDEAGVELAAGPKRGDFLSLLPPAGADPHAGSTSGQVAEAGSRAATAGAESLGDVAQRGRLTGNTMSFQVQALMQETAALRPQPRPSGLRGPREVGNADRMGRLDASPSATTRLGKEVTKNSKADTKQRSSAMAKEILWACGADRIGGAKQQNEAVHPTGTGKAAGVWPPTGSVVDGAAGAHAPKPIPIDPARGHQAAALQITETKDDPGLESCGTPPISSNNVQGGNASTASQVLQPSPGIQAKSTRLLQGSAASIRAYGDEPGPRRGLAMGHTEIKFSFGASSALLQMPVAVSTVSTALPSATASDFCHGQSQPTDVAGEAGAWRPEQAPLSTEAAIKDDGKPLEAKEPGRKEGGGTPLDNKSPETASAKQTKLDSVCQSTRERDDLRRDASNACLIQ